MKNNSLNTWWLGAFFVALFFIYTGSQAQDDPDSSNKELLDLKYPIPQDGPMPEENKDPGGIYLNDPSNIETEIEYNPETGTYEVKRKIGDKIDHRRPSYMDMREYMDYDSKKAIRQYWDEKVESEDIMAQEKIFKPSVRVKGEWFKGIFGGDEISIRPQGSAELIMGVNSSKTDNPNLPIRQRRITTFDFDQKIQLNVTGEIGTALKLNMSYNTDAMFDFENVTKLGYTGDEDQIIQFIEAGNVSLPLKGTLITGSQSLFGVKAGLRFGKLNVTTIVSQQRGDKSEIEIKGGAQIKEFEVKADEYDYNRHFFLSHFFRDNYESWVDKPPLLASEIFITKIEVYKMAINAYENTRNVIAFQDLGTADPDRMFNPTWAEDQSASNIPSNQANRVYEKAKADPSVRAFTNAGTVLEAQGLADRMDFLRVGQAELLVEGQDYEVHKQLGYISMTSEVQVDFALAVAFQFTYRGKTYQVGEFSTDGIVGQDALFLKMLKSTELNTKAPLWDLMMKNIYSLGYAYQISKEGFMLDIWYLDQNKGVDINYLPRGSVKDRSIIQLLGLDRLNINNQPYADGIFDFLDNPRITIIPKNGKIIIPKLEPFGSGIRDAFTPGEETTADLYAFDSLYVTTQANAKVKYPNRNRFTIKGQYESSISSDISLGAFNLPEGSVVVSAGGTKLTENVDYTVDYNMGRVKIINTGLLESQTPIKVSFESNSAFNLQQKSMIGSRFDYEVNKKLALGGTVMNLSERLFTANQKVNVGNEPVNNWIYGVDGTYQTESEFVTTLLNKLPFVNSKEKAQFNINGEFAHLLPGHSRAIGKDGTSYIDDFEGSQSTIDLRARQTWEIASTPKGQPTLFPEGEVASKNVAYGFNRAKLNWYTIDPTAFYRQSNINPSGILNNDSVQGNHLQRQVFQKEVFPERDPSFSSQPQNIAMFDLAFYPGEKGPYNYDVDGFDENGVKYAEGIDENGNLLQPETRWGGIMRSVTTTDWDAANVEFIQFWMMDPYAEAGTPGYPDANVDGQLFFNIGNISEDILKDGEKFFENGLPTTEEETTDLTTDNFSDWGRIIPRSVPHLLNAFDNNDGTRPYQDVGLDGLRDQEEREFFKEKYLDKIASVHGSTSAAYSNAEVDPSNDNFVHYLDESFGDEQSILARYKNWRGLENNSPAGTGGDNFTKSNSTLPNVEDLNNDRNMNEGESYFQYRVNISTSDVNPNNVGSNYITNVVETRDANTNKPVTWYQFKIPIRDLAGRESFGINPNYQNIRFIRVFLKGFERPVFLRFAALELVRGEWRKFFGNNLADGPVSPQDQFANFNIAAVNIEENSNKKPVNYVLPPDIVREVNLNTVLQRQNEQAMSFNFCDLKDGSFQGAYRAFDYDVRFYKRLKMFVHLEDPDPNQAQLFDDELTAFIRLGSDFENNYYEYEIPLKVTPHDFYNKDDPTAQRAVWPEDNEFDIELSLLTQLKTERNEKVLNGEATVLKPYIKEDPNFEGRLMKVVGNPNLNELKSVMIGVNNPKDDGFSKCGEMWVNELRLTEFDNKGGWAAVGSIEGKLPGLGTARLAGGISTPGFGSIDQKVGERQRETRTNFDASFATDVGTFLPEEASLKIPMFVSIGEEVIRPEYDPLNPDVKMKDVLQSNSITDSWKDSLVDISKDYTLRKSINFTNVRKEKTSKTNMPYDLSNFSFSYSYSKLYHRNINIDHDVTKNYRGGINYTYSPKAKPITPFKKVKFFKSKYLQLIRDMNLYYLPKQFTFRTEVDRMYNQRFMRNTNPGIRADLPLFVNKTFNWRRQYDFKYDITRNLKFDFNATNMSLITEPPGKVDRKASKRNDNNEFKDWRDSVITSATMGGGKYRLPA